MHGEKLSSSLNSEVSRISTTPVSIKQAVGSVQIQVLIVHCHAFHWERLLGIPNKLFSEIRTVLLIWRDDLTALRTVFFAVLTLNLSFKREMRRSWSSLEINIGRQCIRSGRNLGNYTHTNISTSKISYLKKAWWDAGCVHIYYSLQSTQHVQRIASERRELDVALRTTLQAQSQVSTTDFYRWICLSHPPFDIKQVLRLLRYLQ